ncbi:hypothetical protein MCHI_001640, partial [Candidatus Magnetoovum chiemensis]
MEPILINEGARFDTHEELHDLVIYEIKEKFKAETDLLYDLEDTIVTSNDMSAVIDHIPTEDNGLKFKEMFDIISLVIAQKVKVETYINALSAYLDTYTQTDKYEDNGFFLRRFQATYIISEIKEKFKAETDLLYDLED